MSTTTMTPARPRRELPPLMSLTDAAAERLKALYATGQAGMLLRISVNTKGCSGLAYDMTWTDVPGPGDERVTDKGMTVLVDRKASLFLIGTIMDYEVKALSSGFTFVNPNDRVLEGDSLSKALARTGYFPRLLLDRVAVAEQTGNLAPGLRDISRSYRAELDRWLGTISQTISASVLVAAFSFVAFIAFAIVAAVFEVSSSFRF